MAIGRPQLVALDCGDPQALAAFYSAVTGWPIVVPDWLDDPADEARWLELVAPAGMSIAFQRIDGYVPPTWPGGDRPTQLHLDIEVDDLDEGETAVVALGARKCELQPDPVNFRVFLDPAGHPFCLVR